MSDMYTLVDKKPVPVKDGDVLAWGKFMDDIDSRRVAVSVYQNGGETTKISTVFLGIDHSFSDDSQPILFETMIFGGPHSDYMERYTSWDEAMEGHKRAMKMVSRNMEEEETCDYHIGTT